WGDPRSSLSLSVFPVAGPRLLWLQLRCRRRFLLFVCSYQIGCLFSSFFSHFFPPPCGTISFSDFSFSSLVASGIIGAPSRGMCRAANERPWKTPSRISFTRKVRPSVLVKLVIFGSQNRARKIVAS